MGNCLVTKLKGVVDNDNLPKYNTIRFGVSVPLDFNPPAGVSYFFFCCYGGSNITSVTGELFDVCNVQGEVLESDLSTYSYQGWINVKPHAGKNYIFEISPKYGLIGFGCNGPQLTDCISIDDISEFCWYSDLREITLGTANNTYNHTNIKGTFKLPEGTTNFNKFIVNCCRVSANINMFANITTLLNCDSYRNNLVEGSIHSLANNLGLISLKLVENHKVTGDLKTLAEAMVANGRTSGQIEVHGWNTLLTIDGVLYNTKVKAEGENNWYVDIIFDSSLDAGYRFNYR